MLRIVFESHSVGAAVFLLLTHSIYIGYVQSATAQEEVGLQRVSIIGPDDRRELPEVQQQLSFSKDEMLQASACTGYLACPGANNGQGSYSSAASILASNQIATARHLFYNSSGQPIAQPSACYFKNYLGQRSNVVVQEDDLKRLAFESNSTRKDYIVVRLADALQKCGAYQLNQTIEVEPGQKLIALSHIQEGMPAKYRGRFPIVQQCEVKKTFFAKYDDPSVFYSDCDNAKGGSGGINLMRVDGQLFAVGISVAGGSPNTDGKPYNEKLKSQTVVVAIDAGFLQMALSSIESKKPPSIEDDPILAGVVTLSVGGLILRELTAELQILYSLPDDLRGVLVGSTKKDAELISEGDVLLFGNDMPLPNLDAVRGLIGELRRAGRSSVAVKLRVRSGETKNAIIQLDE